MASNCRLPRFSNAVQFIYPVKRRGADIKNEKLIFLRVQNHVRQRDQADLFLLGEFAEKHAVLNMFSVILQKIEKLGPPFVLRDIVGAKVELALMSYLTVGHGMEGMSFLNHRARRRA